MVGQRSVMTGIALLVLVHGLAGCGDSGSPAAPSAVPSAPSPVAPPGNIQLVVFTDAGSGFSTSDVRDVHDQIVRFNRADELIWTADGTRFSGYRVDGNAITAEAVCHSCYFLIRIASRDGEQRAYLTWPDVELHGRADHPPPTILDIEVVGGQLVITDTNVRVPGWE